MKRFSIILAFALIGSALAWALLPTISGRALEQLYRKAGLL